MRAKILFKAKTIVTSLPRNIYSDRPKNNTIIKFSLCVVNVLKMFFIIKINLFKYKRFKDGRCRYKIIVSNHLKAPTVQRSSVFKRDGKVYP